MRKERGLTVFHGENSQCRRDQESKRIKWNIADEPPYKDQDKDRDDDMILCSESGTQFDTQCCKNERKNHGITPECSPEITMQDAIKCPSESTTGTIKMRDLVKNAFGQKLAFAGFVEVYPRSKNAKKEKCCDLQQTFFGRAISIHPFHVRHSKLKIKVLKSV